MLSEAKHLRNATRPFATLRVTAATLRVTAATLKVTAATLRVTARRQP